MKKLMILMLLLTLILVQCDDNGDNGDDGNGNDSAWSDPICDAAQEQQYAKIVSDGLGGAIITWEDERSDDGDIYAQRVNANGDVQWTTNGVAICTSSGEQELPQIVSDGAGGAIITWKDESNDWWGDIYAQRIDANGAVQWTTNGVAICAAQDEQQSPQITADGSGGAIITWEDERDSTGDIYAQRVNGAGAVQWKTNGVAICKAAGEQQYPQIVSDGSGGAIITWDNWQDIYAQRVNANGTVRWKTNGVAVSTASKTQRYPQITSDGSSGAIITWRDERSNPAISSQNDSKDEESSNSSIYWDIYAQRVNGAGVAQWKKNGVAICRAANNQGMWRTAGDGSPQITSDGSGGAIITWEDERSNPNAEESSDNTYLDIYAQHVNSAGVVQWQTNGVAICTATGYQGYPQVISDGYGGTIITWEDQRSDSLGDIYAQCLNAAGVVQWTAGGVAICTATAEQQIPQLTTDGSGGAIITWEDERDDSGNIYAQGVNSDGSK